MRRRAQAASGAMRDAWSVSAALLKDMGWLVAAIFIANQAWMMWQDVADPFTAYFEPRRLLIPDHCEGDDPPISYESVVHRSFSGAYGGAFDAADGSGFPVCSDALVRHDYVPKAAAVITMPLSDFTGNTVCHLPAGRWVRHEFWEAYVPGRHTLRQSIDSNLFTVWPKSDPHCQ